MFPRANFFGRARPVAAASFLVSTSDSNRHNAISNPQQAKRKGHHEDEVPPCARAPRGGILRGMLPRPAAPPGVHRRYVGTAANESAAAAAGDTTEAAEEAVIIGGQHQCLHLTGVSDEDGGGGGIDPNEEEGSRRIVLRGDGRELPADPAQRRGPSRPRRAGRRQQQSV